VISTSELNVGDLQILLPKEAINSPK